MHLNIKISTKLLRTFDEHNIVIFIIADIWNISEVYV